MKQLYVVGIGPGKHGLLTIEAAEVLAACDTIVGYNVYVDLVREYYPDKEYLATGMTREVQRCRLALEAAEGGRTTAMICSGDAGVYGMAGIMLELGINYPEVDIEIVPGITAALSGAAILGAPLGHDFSIISLSDLLIPWEKIARRIECAAMSDMAIVIYNPSSRKRSDYLARACEIMLQYISPDTVCGYVRNIGREGEKHEILPLKELKAAEVDMFTTVFIGNASTECINGRMVTPRGYRL